MADLGPPGDRMRDAGLGDQYIRDHHAGRIRRGGPGGQWVPVLAVLLGFVLLGTGVALSLEPLQWVGGLAVIGGSFSVLFTRTRP